MMPSLPIVGIGASAGGVEALEQFFKSLPAGNGLAFVVLTHLGTELIERGLRFELQGEAKLETVNGGLRCKDRDPGES